MQTFFLICALGGSTILVCQFVMTLIGLGGDGGDFELGTQDAGLHVHAMSDTNAETPAQDGHVPLNSEQLGSESQHGTNWLFGVLTFRTVVTFIAFFGLTGMLGTSAGWGLPATLFAAVAAGAAAVYGVQSILRMMHNLRADGTAQIQRAVGMPGTVYLSVPGANNGAGKIHLVLQNRTLEVEAVTAADKLPAGARVVVTRVLGPDRVEVAAAE
jgi:hypothetical protein